MIFMNIFLKIRYYKCCITIKLIKVKKLILLKVTAPKNGWFTTIGFFYHGFEFHDRVCSGCHDLTMLCLNISDITITTDKNVNYRCIMHNINKCEAINLSKHFLLEDRGYIWKNIALNFGLFKTCLFVCFFLFFV